MERPCQGEEDRPASVDTRKPGESEQRGWANITVAEVDQTRDLAHSGLAAPGLLARGSTPACGRRHGSRSKGARPASVSDMTSVNANANLPGTYRLADGSRVAFADALAIWVPVAHEELIATAKRYHAVITYKELSERVQERSGIRTRVLLTNWIGRLLEEVSLRAKANGEPPLTSLCVHQDGTIGPGYARAPRSVVDSPGEDIEYYAAEHRLLCYREYAMDLPDDGGRPALTKAESERRARKAAVQPVSQPVCPNCSTVLPATARCDYCG